MIDDDDQSTPPKGKGELALTFVRELRKRSDPERGLRAEKAFFDELSGDTGIEEPERL